MPELLLDEPHVGPVLQHERRAGVAEQVTAPAFACPGRADVIADKLGQPTGLKRSAQGGQKHRAVVRPGEQLRAGLLNVAGDPCERAGTGTDKAIGQKCYEIATGKVMQVWRTGYLAGKFDDLVYAGQLNEGSSGPPSSGGRVGLPIVDEEGRLNEAASSGVRGAWRKRVRLISNELQDLWWIGLDKRGNGGCNLLH